MNSILPIINIICIIVIVISAYNIGRLREQIRRSKNDLALLETLRKRIKEPGDIENLTNEEREEQIINNIKLSGALEVFKNNLK